MLIPSVKFILYLRIRQADLLTHHGTTDEFNKACIVKAMHTQQLVYGTLKSSCSFFSSTMFHQKNLIITSNDIFSLSNYIPLVSCYLGRECGFCKTYYKLQVVPVIKFAVRVLVRRRLQLIHCT